MTDKGGGAPERPGWAVQLGALAKETAHIKTWLVSYGKEGNKDTCQNFRKRKAGCTHKASSLHKGTD